MRKNKFQRVVAFIITLALVISFVPFSPISVTAPVEASAAGTLSTTVPGLSVSWGDPSNASGKAEWTASGNSITGKATGYTQKFIVSISKNITTKLTLTNNLGSEAVLKFNYTLSNGGSVSGVSGNACEKTLADGAALTITLTSPKGTSTNTLSITDISLKSTASGDITTTFKPAAGGSYTVDGVEITEETLITKGAADSYAVVATPASGQKLCGWYNETTGKYISYDTNTSLILPVASTICPVFIPEDSALFGVGTESAKKSIVVGQGSISEYVTFDIKQDVYTVDGIANVFYDFNEALNYANNSSTEKCVVLMESGTLSKGEYTIPSGVTLLIPFDENNTFCKSDPCSVNAPGSAKTPTPYKTLTMADGANIIVEGAVEVATKHYASHGAKDFGGRPVDGYGHIKMHGSSSIVLKNGAVLYAWGYITGDSKAEVIAESGSTIYEKMQVADYRGGTITTAVTKNGHFPFSQYYVQNVEVKEVINSGSKLICHAAIYASSLQEESINFMGTESGNSNPMFALGAKSKATKYYDVENDRLVVDVEGEFSFNSIELMDENTADFALPLQQNLTINLKSGTVAKVNQDILMQPGCTINIEDGATLEIGSENKLYLMDKEEWGTFCGAVREYVIQITYTPSHNGAPNIRDTAGVNTKDKMTDAKLNVNGTLVVNGTIYASNSHASIVSDGKNGVIQFNTDVIESAQIYQYSTVTGDYQESLIDMSPVVLTNTDDTTVDTTGTAAGTIYYFHCDIWQTSTVDAAVDPTCTETGLTEGSHYTTCGHVLVPQNPIDALGHDYTGDVKDNGNGTHSYLCKNGCGTYGNEHACEFVSVVTDPTCTEKGYTTHTCSECGDTYKDNEVAALGHSYNAVVTDPTCTEKGYTTHTCSVCGDTYKDSEVAATGHDYDEGVVTTDPTCTNKGVKTFTCATCGDSYTEEVAALGHTEGPVVVENNVDPTCTATGSYDTVVYCTVCGEELSRVTTTVDALGHTEGEVVKENVVAPTCTEDGSHDEVTYCTVCNKELTRVTKTDEKLGHKEGAAVEENRVNATCAADGSYDIVVYCTECDAELSRTSVTVDALNHNYESVVTSPTCTEKGYTTHTCSRCGDSYTDSETEATGHHFEHGVCVDGDVKLGDTNGDGDITTADVTILNAFILGKVELDEEELILLDINGDGKITTADVALLNAINKGKIQL